MGFNRENEAKPISNIYFDVSLPAVDANVVLVNGVPSGGTDIGALAKGIKWSPEYDLTADEVENYNAPIGYDKTMTGLKMTVPMKEISGQNLKLASGGKLIVVGDGTKSIRIGTGNDIETHSWLVVWERKAGSGIFEQAMIYEGVVEKAVELQLASADYSVLEITIAGRVVSGRDTTDNLGFCTAFQ
jgi:hypothetical protein